MLVWFRRMKVLVIHVREFIVMDVNTNIRNPEGAQTLAVCR